MKRSDRIVVVGSGNVAEALCRALPASGYALAQVFARNPERGRALAGLAGCGWENNPEKLAEADIYLLAVSDRAIPELSETLGFGGGLVAHTSGSCDLAELSPGIARRGVFYPLQTFTSGREVDFREIPLFIEAENESDYAVLQALASGLSGSVYRSDSFLRRKMHVAAVFVCNFVNGLYAAGEEWMQAHGMDFGLLKPLIAETANKMLAADSPLSVQTGPAVREDRPTLDKHLQLLEDNPDLKNIYEVLTGHIVRMKKTDGKL